ncbi:MAG: F0F1 ATP synthase subunit gamma, partial [Nitrospirales bacterium]
ERGGVFDRLSFEHALEIGQNIVSQYQEGAFDEGYVVYNEFKSVMQQEVTVEKWLPIEPLHEPNERENRYTGGGYLYEPDEKELLETLLPKYFEIQTYRILLESAAAEQAARMTAMDGATRNAGELIKKVTLFYNKTRQAAITKELMDIVGGSEALK